MTESAGKGEAFPEALVSIRDELLADNARLTEAGEDDGLMELRTEVASDPVALKAYADANDRTRRLKAENHE